MIRLLISVEGKSEKNFVERELIPHLTNFDVYAKVQNMKGNISLDRIGAKLNTLIHNYDYITTLYDFYGFKKLSKGETKKGLEQKIKDKINKDKQDKIIPYIQMYEFEALLFSDEKKIVEILNIKDENFVSNTLEECNNNPENINNSPITAPSKRIVKESQYIKTTHAPLILKNIGLTKIRKKCAGFDEWLSKLENLNKT
jgi:hypothetical protein